MVPDPMNEMLNTPPSSPEAKPASSEMPGSGVPRTPPYRAPAASSSSAGPIGDAPTPNLWANWVPRSSQGEAAQWGSPSSPLPAVRQEEVAQAVPPSSTLRAVFLESEGEIIDPELWQSMDGEPNPDFPVAPWYPEQKGKGKGKGKGKNKGKDKGKNAAGKGRTRTPRRTSWEASSAGSGWSETGTSWRENEWYG